MNGYEYEQKCAELLKALNFSDIKVTPGSGDQGIDIIAYKSGKKYGIQCKYYEGTVGNKAIQEVFTGAFYYDCSIALIITSSTLTKPAKELADKLDVEVWESIDDTYLKIHTSEYKEVIGQFLNVLRLRYYFEYPKYKKQRELERRQREEIKREEEEKRRIEEEKRRKKAEKRQRKRLAKKIREQEEKEREAIRQAELTKLAPKYRPIYQLASEMITCSSKHIVVVKADGTVVAVGNNDNEQCNISEWKDVVKVKTCENATVGVTINGEVYSTLKRSGYDLRFKTSEWKNILNAGFCSKTLVIISCSGDIRWFSDTYVTVLHDDQWADVDQLICEKNSIKRLTKDDKVLTTNLHNKKSTSKLLNTETGKILYYATNGWGQELYVKETGKVVFRGYNEQILSYNEGKFIVGIHLAANLPLAILADGTIRYWLIDGSPKGFPEFLEQNNIQKVVAISSCYDKETFHKVIAILTEQGKVYCFFYDKDGNTISSDAYGMQPFGEDFQMFTDFHKQMQEKNIVYEKNKEEMMLAEKKEKQQKVDWRKNGVCQHCGGAFKKALFGYKCTICGKRKDY